MHYVAKIAATGAEVDSSRSKGRPFSFVIGCGAVIPGWDQVRRREEKRRRREEKGGEEKVGVLCCVVVCVRVCVWCVCVIVQRPSTAFYSLLQPSIAWANKPSSSFFLLPMLLCAARRVPLCGTVCDRG